LYVPAVEYRELDLGLLLRIILLEQTLDGLLQVTLLFRAGDQVDKDLAVHRGLEDRTLGFQFIFQRQGVDQVPVMSEGQVLGLKVSLE
jgi:hypothetical protein